MDKLAYALVKALKSFRTFVLHSIVIAFVASITVKDILTQPNSVGKRGKWIAKILEYDLEFKPTKLVKGQGLVKLLENSNYQDLGINSILHIYADQLISNGKSNLQVESKCLDSKWYKDIVYFLQNVQCPSNFDKNKFGALKLWLSSFVP